MSGGGGRVLLSSGSGVYLAAGPSSAGLGVLCAFEEQLSPQQPSGEAVPQLRGGRAGRGDSVMPGSSLALFGTGSWRGR